MAVVQISRIQVRRGQKTQGTGLPQLASGEFGWAIDTQELYIGNGAVSEGAPAVGNTLILTENSNLFEYASNYTYDIDDNIVQTGATTTSPVRRSLQNRLDDIVSVKAFGVVGDGVVDVTEELQRAVDELFLNAATVGNPESRVVLHMEAGTYNISDTIYLPPYVTIKGAGIDKTVINQTGAVPIFATVNGNSIPGTPADDAVSTFNNQARFIEISGMTLSLTGQNRAIALTSCRDSQFKDLKLTGLWESGDAITDAFSGIEMNALSPAVSCQNNLFENLQIEGFANGILNNSHNDHNKWISCRFETLGFGVKFGADGSSDAPTLNVIENSLFKNIDRTALYINKGQYNLSTKNQYISVGNDGGIASNATYPVVLFNDTFNDSKDDYFERSIELGVDGTHLDTDPYVPTIQGYSFHDEGFYYKTSVGYEASATTVFRMPADASRSFKLEYWYTSAAYNAHRSGVLNIVFDINLVGSITSPFQMSEEYDYVGDATYKDRLQFSLELSDEDSDATEETLNLKITNTALGDNASLHFKLQNRS